MSKAAAAQQQPNEGAEGEENGNANDTVAGGEGKDAAGEGDGSDAGSIYKPEGLAEHFLGKDDRETIDKLNRAVIGFRTDLSKKGVPDKPEGYELKLDDEIKSKILRLDKDGKDPLLEKAKSIFHKRHVPADAFQEIVVEFFQAAAAMQEEAAQGDGGEGSSPVDFEYKSLGGKEKVQAEIDGTNVWIGSLVKNNTLSKEAAAELQLMASYGEGLKTLMELRKALGGGEKNIPRDMGGDAPEGITEAMIDERWADPRSWQPGSIDNEFVAETRRMSRLFYAAKK